jgi:hypothetical protein
MTSSIFFNQGKLLREFIEVVVERRVGPTLKIEAFIYSTARACFAVPYVHLLSTHFTLHLDRSIARSS